MSGINPDYSKRDCSLPPGCKDLMDVLRLESDPHPETKVVELGSPVTVKGLAALLGRTPFQIIADLLELKVMANADQSLTFEVAARAATKYGLVAKRAA